MNPTIFKHADAAALHVFHSANPKLSFQLWVLWHCVVCPCSCPALKFIQVRCGLTATPTLTWHTDTHAHTQWPHCMALLQRYPSRMPEKSADPRDTAGSGWQLGIVVWVLLITPELQREKEDGSISDCVFFWSVSRNIILSEVIISKTI